MKTDPNQLLLELKSRLKTKRVHANLENVHEVCRQIYDGPSNGISKDYSIVSVARKLELLKKGPSYNTLRATAGAHFRQLIRGWAECDGTDSAKPPRHTAPHNESDRLLSRIADLALRSLVAFELAKGRTAMAELETLKGHTVLTIDMRPKDGASLAQSPAESALALIEPPSPLLGPERAALEQAVDEMHLGRFGLETSGDGEIVATNGKRVLFSAGFSTGLKKLLGKSSATMRGR